jgi:hypothetical protein
MKIGAVIGIKYFTHLRNCLITPGKKVPATTQNIFLKKSRKKEPFSNRKNPALYRLKTEHYAYMSRTPIIYVQILSYFNRFFNGGFT